MFIKPILVNLKKIVLVVGRKLNHKLVKVS